MKAKTLGPLLTVAALEACSPKAVEQPPAIPITIVEIQDAHAVSTRLILNGERAQYQSTRSRILAEAPQHMSLEHKKQKEQEAWQKGIKLGWLPIFKCGKTKKIKKCNKVRFAEQDKLQKIHPKKTKMCENSPESDDNWISCKDHNIYDKNEDALKIAFVCEQRLLSCIQRTAKLDKTQQTP